MRDAEHYVSVHRRHVGTAAQRQAAVRVLRQFTGLESWDAADAIVEAWLTKAPRQPHYRRKMMSWSAVRSIALAIFFPWAVLVVSVNALHPDMTRVIGVVMLATLWGWVTGTAHAHNAHPDANR